MDIKITKSDFESLFKKGDLCSAVSKDSRLVIQQRKEFTELVLGLETRNRYLIFDSSGARCGSINEEGSGLIGLLKRVLLKSHRPFSIWVSDADGNAVFLLTRPFYFFFSDLQVARADGTPIGSITRRFGLTTTQYDLKDSQGFVVARIRNTLFQIWTFSIYDEQGIEIGKITKKWGGLLKEYFTDTDNFLIEFGSKNWTALQRTLIFAASISIDFDFFENNNK